MVDMYLWKDKEILDNLKISKEVYASLNATKENGYIDPETGYKMNRRFTNIGLKKMAEKIEWFTYYAKKHGLI